MFHILLINQTLSAGLPTELHAVYWTKLRVHIHAAPSIPIKLPKNAHYLTYMILIHTLHSYNLYTHIYIYILILIEMLSYFTFPLES
jgi:hypothetical protein